MIGNRFSIMKVPLAVCDLRHRFVDTARALISRACGFGKLDPCISMVQSAEDRMRNNVS
jgi:hypothetical protein